MTEDTLEDHLDEGEAQLSSNQGPAERSVQLSDHDDDKNDILYDALDYNTMESPLSAPTGEVIVPRTMDIFCGRGKYMSHPGNARFQSIIERHRHAYQQTPRREEKSAIAARVAREIKSEVMAENNPLPLEPVRFLLKTQHQGFDRWTVVDDEYIREKISHALRSQPKSAQKRRAAETEEKRVQHSKRQKQVLSGIQADVESILQEQQELLKKLISAQVLHEHDSSVALNIGASSDSSLPHDDPAPADTLKNVEGLNANWRSCPMEKGLHICHHLG